MPFDSYMADRIHAIMQEKDVNYFAKKMMGGLIFMVNDKMCCGIHYDKKKETDLLMIRIGEEAYENNKTRIGCKPMDFTGRPMKGYAFITPEGYDMDSDLQRWIDLALLYNPIAKSSRKKKI